MYLKGVTRQGDPSEFPGGSKFASTVSMTEDYQLLKRLEMFW